MSVTNVDSSFRIGDVYESPLRHTCVFCARGTAPLPFGRLAYATRTAESSRLQTLPDGKEIFASGLYASSRSQTLPGWKEIQ